MILEKDKENYIVTMEEIKIYLDELYRRRVKLSRTSECLIESIGATASWKYARQKICILTEDYMLPFFMEKMAALLLEERSLKNIYLQKEG